MQQQSQDRIAQLAYELWQQRGCPQGSPDVDWEQACRMLESASMPDNEVLSVPPPVSAAGDGAVGNGVDDVPSASTAASGSNALDDVPSPGGAASGATSGTDRAEATQVAAAPRGIPPNAPRTRGKGRSQRRSAI